jgi:hypothetical protein
MTAAMYLRIASEVTALSKAAPTFFPRQIFLLPRE